MTVKELKALLADAPDDLEVMISTSNEFHHPNIEFCGVSEFGEACDEHGTPIEDHRDLEFFLIVSDSALEQCEIID